MSLSIGARIGNAVTNY